jgi:hypothetical protein
MSRNKENLKKVVCFAREAGGAEAIAPVIKKLKRDYTVLLYARDYAKQVFIRHDLPFIEIPSPDKGVIDAILEKQSPDFIFTSATSLPWNDMTERYFWQSGLEREIPTMAVIDQWQNYAIRFSGIGSEEKLAYLPDYICTLDSYAKNQMIADGIPETKILITGQPAFDAILHYQKEFRDKGEKIRETLGISIGDHPIIVFVSEALFRDFKSGLGYSEVDALRILLDSIKTEAETNKGQKYTLIIKLHPQNRLEDFDALDIDRYRNFFTICWIGTEVPPRDTVMIADIVVGMASILLVESILLQKPTISLQPNTQKDNNLIATKTRAIPLINNSLDFGELFHRLLSDDKYRSNYLKTQKKISVDGHAADRIVTHIRQIAGGNR